MSNVYANGYGNNFPDSNIISAFFRQMRNLQKDGLKNDSKISLLDIGCGIGANLQILDYYENITYHGVEINETARDSTANRIVSSGLENRAKVFLSSTEIFLENNQEVYDVILDRASLQHHAFLKNRFKRSDFFDLLISRLHKTGIFISLWAGQENLNTSIRFPSFVPFEEIAPTFQLKLKIQSLERISRFNVIDGGQTKTNEEYLIAAQRIEN
jgi:SAM-dependent methyltransferase